MKIILCDRNQAVVDAWTAVGLYGKCDSIFSEPADAIVSPANSFGFMDGGIDLAYSERFGWHVEEKVQAKIKNDFGGELLIGQALSVGTDDPVFPHLISAPTMRVPMMIPDPYHIRMATRAALREAIRLSIELDIESIVFPGMGAGVGKVKPEWVAAMMKAGIEDALSPRPFPRSLNVAVSEHYAVKA